MAQQVKVTRYYREKKENGTFTEDEKIYFGTYGNFVIVRRPPSTDNYEDLQTCLDRMEQKIKNVVTWNIFSSN